MPSKSSPGCPGWTRSAERAATSSLATSLSEETAAIIGVPDETYEASFEGKNISFTLAR